MQPTGQPTMQPTCHPSGQPSAMPSGQPSGQPSKQPSSQPTRIPSGQPTRQPTTQPSSQPTNPTSQPSSQPTERPSSQPSSQPTNPTSYPTSVYYLFDANEKYNAYMSTPRAISSDLKFGISANKESDYATFASNWLAFIENEVNSPFDMNYYEMGLYTNLATFDCLPVEAHKTASCSEPYEKEFVCTDAEKTNFMARQMIKKVPFHIDCDGNPWDFTASGLFCVNCDLSSDTNLLKECAAFAGKAIIPAQLSCQKLIERTSVFNVTRFTTVFTMKQSLIVRDSVPQISALNVIPSRTHVDITLDTTCIYPGCIFSCAALPSGTTVSSANMIRSLGTSKTFDTNNLDATLRTLLPLSLPTGSLIPGERYDVYCFGADMIGNPSSRSMVLATKTTLYTLCCKDVTFNFAPAFLYADPSRYVSSQQYTFQFSISIKPKHDLTVTPLLSIYNRDGTMRLNTIDTSLNAQMVLNALSIVPSSFTFSSLNADTASALQGTFVVTSKFKDIGAFCKLQLVVTGTDAAEYGSDARDFELISSIGAPPPPTLLSVTFSSSASSISVKFDSNTDLGINASPALARIPSSWNCSDIMMFKGSDYTTCAWASNDEITMVFPPSLSTGVVFNGVFVKNVALLNPGDLVSLRPSKLRAQCVSGTQCEKYSFAGSSSRTASAPLNPVLPVISWNMPTEIGACENITIDATGSTGNGGRAWAQMVFTVSTTKPVGAQDTSVAAIQSYLNKINSLQSITKIPGTLMNDTLVYVFSLRLTNYYGGVAAGTASVRKSLSTDVPQVKFLGSMNRQMLASETLNLQVIGSASSCGKGVTAVTTLSYKWLGYRGVKYDSSLVSKSIDPTKMVLNANTLISGESYRFTAIVITRAGIRANASTDITVLKDVVSAKINGGSKQVTPLDKQLVLDGSSSVDLNAPIGAAISTLSYKWSCMFNTITKYGSSCDGHVFYNETYSAKGPLVATNLSTLIIPAYRLSGNDTYEFRLSCSASDGRVGTTSVVIAVSAPGAPKVAIAISGSTTGSKSVIKFSSEQKIVLTGDITCAGCDADAVWSVTPDPTVALPQIALFPVSTSVLKSNKASQVTFSVAGIYFVPGRSYTFRLTATNRLATTATSYSEVAVVMNAPPTQGSVSVTPLIGTALLTRFNAFCTPFFDEDIPVLYRYFYYTVPNVNGLGNLGSAFTEKTFVETSLPQGNINYDNKVAIGVIAQDSFGARTNSSTLVTVNRFALMASPSPAPTLAPNFDAQAPTLTPTASPEKGGGISKEVQNVIADTLSNVLTSSSETGNSDMAAQVIDMVAGMLNSAVDCSGAPSPNDCKTKYHRSPCSSSPHMCGSCLESDGFFGLYGAGNTKCRYLGKSASAANFKAKYPAFNSVDKIVTSQLVNLPSVAISSTPSSSAEYNGMYGSCTVDDVCGWGECVFHLNSTTGICQPYYKTCLSTDPQLMCSGHGTCAFFESSGMPVTDCLATNENCYAHCACHKGYTGGDCNILTASFTSTEAIRETLCLALANTTSKLDKSADSLDVTSTSLANIINPFEITTPRVIQACLKPLTMLQNMAQEGYVVGTRSAAQSLLASLSSVVQILKRRDADTAFQAIAGAYQSSSTAVKSQSVTMVSSNLWLDMLQSENIGSPTLLKPFKHHLSAVNPYEKLGFESALKGVVNAIHQDMLPGEIPRSLVTDNIKVNVYYESISAFSGGRTLVAPLSNTDILYERSTSSITLPHSGLQSCRIQHSDFIIFSVMSLEYVPHVNSDRMVSSLLRFSTALPPSAVAKGATSSPIVFNQTDPGFGYDRGHEGFYSAYDSSYLGDSKNNKTQNKPKVLCRGFTCYSDVSATYDITLPFHRKRIWAPMNPDAYSRNHRAELEYDVQTFPSCGRRDDDKTYKLCLTHAESAYSEKRVTYKLVTLSDLCPNAMGAGNASPLANALTDENIQTFAAIYDQRTYIMYMETGYQLTIPALSTFTSVLALILTVGWYVVKRDRADRQLVKQYLHRDLKKFGPKDDIELLSHVNAIVKSVGIKNKYGQDFEGDSDDDDEYDVWKNRSKDIQSVSTPVKSAVSSPSHAPSIKETTVGETAQSPNHLSILLTEEPITDISNVSENANKSLVISWDAEDQCSEEGKSALELILDSESSDDGSEIGPIARSPSSRKSNTRLSEPAAAKVQMEVTLDDSSSSDSESDVNKKNGVYPAQMTEPKKAQIDLHLNMLEDDDDASSDASDVSKHSSRSHTSAGSAHSDGSEHTEQGLYDHIELDGFSSGIRNKVDSFLGQALYLNKAMFKSRKRLHFVDLYTVFMSVIPLHECTKMFCDVRTFIRSRGFDYTLLVSRTLLLIVACTVLYDVTFPSDYNCERKVNNLYSQMDSAYLSYNQTREQKCLIGQPVLFGDIYPPFPTGQCNVLFVFLLNLQSNPFLPASNPNPIFFHFHV